MTTQLWAWKYNGQDEVGFIMARGKLVLQKPDFFFSYRDQDGVTNLRPAKVVDEDAITISRSLWLEIQVPNEGSESWQNAFRWMVRQIKSENPQLSPPVTEPTGFGAIVEADRSSDQNRQMFVKNLFWFRKDDPERGFLWNSLQNPVVISEGQK